MASWPDAQGFQTHYINASTGATPLSIIKEGIGKGDSISHLMDKIPTYQQLFFGNMGGSIGEVTAIALILGLAYMLLRKIITWHIPVSIILTVVIFTGILWLINPEQNADPLFHILSGGILLGAIFMATDYVTSPMTGKGMILYGICIGILTIVILQEKAPSNITSFPIYCAITTNTRISIIVPRNFNLRCCMR